MKKSLIMSFFVALTLAGCGTLAQKQDSQPFLTSQFSHVNQLDCMGADELQCASLATMENVSFMRACPVAIGKRELGQYPAQKKATDSVKVEQILRNWELSKMTNPSIQEAFNSNNPTYQTFYMGVLDYLTVLPEKQLGAECIERLEFVIHNDLSLQFTKILGQAKTDISPNWYKNYK